MTDACLQDDQRSALVGAGKDARFPAADGDEIQISPAMPEEKKPKDIASTDDHETLKYHLLGPSLTKAGQDSVDQQRVSEVIYEASKGSKFFNNEEVKDRNLTRKIDKILARKRQLERLDLAADRRRADDYLTELEMSRDLTQTVVHIDCDAFYAAVEELEHPHLRDVPMAVGKGVLTTCNYHARKFGCRSGMAGFVAMKLCPQLVCLPLNFARYTAKAQEVRDILAEYDSRFESASIDEAYLNITQYCQDHGIDPEDAVCQMRHEVQTKTGITISAGVAPNAKIAKIASNRNKPNGQFRVANDRAVVLAFMRDLPTRKVNGVGRVFERELDAIGIKTCGDIHAQRQFLSKLFGEKAAQFLLQTYLGLGRTKVQPIEDHERKSVGTESTFKDKSGKEELRAQLRWTAEELAKDMQRTQFKGRTLVLKAKLHTYEVINRQVIPPKAVSTADELYTQSLPMLAKLEKELPEMRLRLMGLRCTHLVSTKKRTAAEFFGVAEEFEAAAKQEREGEFADALRLSQELQEDVASVRMDSAIGFRKPETGYRKRESAPLAISWTCPICNRLLEAEERAFNEHVDFCLSRGTIKEAVSELCRQDSEDNPMQKVPVALGLAGPKAQTELSLTARKRQKQKSIVSGQTRQSLLTRTKS